MEEPLGKMHERKQQKATHDPEWRQQPDDDMQKQREDDLHGKDASANRPPGQSRHGEQVDEGGVHAGVMSLSAAAAVAGEVSALDSCKLNYAIPVQVRGRWRVPPWPHAC